MVLSEMLELKIVVKILQLMTALLTVMSRGSPVPVQSDDNSSVISDFSSPFNGSSSYNVSDNLLFFGSVLDNETGQNKTLTTCLRVKLISLSLVL